MGLPCEDGLVEVEAEVGGDRAVVFVYVFFFVADPEAEVQPLDLAMAEAADLACERGEGEVGIKRRGEEVFAPVRLFFDKFKVHILSPR